MITGSLLKTSFPDLLGLWKVRDASVGCGEAKMGGGEGWEWRGWMLLLGEP